jgi:hypothetical protein
MVYFPVSHAESSAVLPLVVIIVTSRQTDRQTRQKLKPPMGFGEKHVWGKWDFCVTGGGLVTRGGD